MLSLIFTSWNSFLPSALCLMGLIISKMMMLLEVGEPSFVNMGLTSFSVSHSLVLLLYIIFFLVMGASVHEFRYKNFLSICWLLMIVLVMLFSTNSYTTFYVLFELSLLPILMLIMGWGYQPERFSAFSSMLLYTVSASLPLLMMILMITTTSMESKIFMWNFGLGMSMPVYFIFISMAFIVKLPMYMVHLWLPKAHVEAPVGGSMLLAAILLKMGGYGLIVLFPLFTNYNMGSYIFFLSLLGGTIVSVLCVREIDSKTLIAYSSIAHMSIVTAAIFSQHEMAMAASALMMIAHGITSSGMFFGSFEVYKMFGTRNLAYMGSVSSSYPMFSLGWFLLCMSNMGAPPSFNLLTEIFCSIVIWNFNNVSYFMLSFIFFFAVAFNLILYMSMSHGTSASLSMLYKQLSPLSILVLMWHAVSSISASAVLVLFT